MPAVGHTLLDLKIQVWLRCYGQLWVAEKAGDTQLLEAINRSGEVVLRRLGRLAFADTLYTTASWTANGTYNRFPWRDNVAASGERAAGLNLGLGVLVPVGVSCDTLPTHQTTAEKLFSMKKTDTALKALNYAFAGAEVWARPTPANGSIITLHYIKTPTALAADGDEVPYDPGLLLAVATRAALMLCQRWPSTTGEKIQTLAQEYENEIGRLLAPIGEGNVREYEGRTGRDLTMQGAAAGLGGQ